MTRLLYLSMFSLLGLLACNGDVTTDSPDDQPDTSSEVGTNDLGFDQSAEDMPSESDASNTDDADMEINDAAPDLPPDTLWMSAGCGGEISLSEGENTFELEDRSRRYILRLPQNYTQERAWPLVFALHGNGGSPAYWDSTTGPRDIRGVVETEAILILAHAIDGNWRDYNMPADTWPARVESELLYFDEMLIQASNGLCVDTRSVFSMGFSGGGSFSGVLGCRREEYRAIAVGGSVMYFTADECIHTPAAWITIGSEELSSGREQFRDFFRDRASCDAETTPTSPEPCVAYSACGVGTPVQYCQHAGGHVWPDFGSVAMWEFFKSFLID